MNNIQGKQNNFLNTHNYTDRSHNNRGLYRKHGIINFDNAATTYPKPDSVRAAVNAAMTKYGGNSGRGGHALSTASSDMVYETRQLIADFFDAQPENVVFTYNCTYAVNLAVKGVMEGKTGHIIISSLEHNAVLRPVHALSRTGNITYSIAAVYDDDEKTVQSFKKLIKPETKAIVCIIASNVTGRILPYKRIAELCEKSGICFIADGAQACGILPVKLTDGINILCTSGHKGLYGITGTGLIVTDGKYTISPSVIQGGTGSSSMSFTQPEFLPDALESGTMSIIGAASLKAGVEFLNTKTLNRIFTHEAALCSRLLNKITHIKGITVYRDLTAPEAYAPIVSFNIKDITSENAAEFFGTKGFCMRAGFHCAALAHKSLNTVSGTVRFAPSIFNTEAEVDRLIDAIAELATSGVSNIP